MNEAAFRPALLKEQYEPELWKKAEELSKKRVELSELTDALFAEVEKMKNEGAIFQELKEIEDSYWQAIKDIDAIKKQEEDLQKVLLGLENGTVSEAELKQIVGAQSANDEKLSKRKQRILEEKERLQRLAKERFGEFGIGGYDELRAPETRHLTTGRRATSVRGNMRPDEAEEIFKQRAVDTHGGKTRKFGKTGDGYIGKGGKKIRKR